VQRPTVTRVLARLEEAGLVERAADPADGRSSLVSCSAAGVALLAELRERNRDPYFRIMVDQWIECGITMIWRRALER
jgi:DNA-binding MarR family transcriptional regulator